MDAFIVELNRPNKNVTWGFSIQGGKDFGCPLSVLRVNPNSLSDKHGIRAQDLILKINDIPTETLTHQQSILNIQNLNVKLELKRVTSESILPPPPSIELNLNNNYRISSSIIDLPPPPPPPPLQEPNSFNSNYEIGYPPPPPPPVGNPVQIKPLQEKKLDQKTILTTGTNNNNNKETIPEVTLKMENLLAFESKLNEKKNKESSASSLGQFLLNQNPDQKRDNKNVVTSRPSHDLNMAICSVCKDHIKGSYIEANNKIYCSNHFCCSFCNKPIKGTQFVETKEGTLYCMDDFVKNVAARCFRCSESIIEHQIMALGKCWHPKCFLCDHCKKPIPQGQFHIKEENNQSFIYCESDYKNYYEIKCFGCKLAIDSDDKYLQVGNNNYHVECFKR